MKVFTLNKFVKSNDAIQYYKISIEKNKDLDENEKKKMILLPIIIYMNNIFKRKNDDTKVYFNNSIYLNPKFQKEKFA